MGVRVIVDIVNQKNGILPRGTIMRYKKYLPENILYESDI